MRQATQVRPQSWEWLERQIVEQIRAAQRLPRQARPDKSLIEVLARHPKSNRPNSRTRKE